MPIACGCRFLIITTRGQRCVPAVWLALCCLLYRGAHHYAESENEQQPVRRKRPFSSGPVQSRFRKAPMDWWRFLRGFPPAPMKAGERTRSYRSQLAVILDNLDPCTSKSHNEDEHPLRQSSMCVRALDLAKRTCNISVCRSLQWQQFDTRVRPPESDGCSAQFCGYKEAGECRLIGARILC
jgi:hypothetical protein